MITNSNCTNEVTNMYLECKERASLHDLTLSGWGGKKMPLCHLKK